MKIHDDALARLIVPYLMFFLIGCDRTNNDRMAPQVFTDKVEKSTEPGVMSDDDAKTIVEKAIKAHGGSQAFSRWNCGYLKYVTKSDALTGGSSEATIEDTFQLPGHFKRVSHVELGGNDMVTVFVVNNGQAWTKYGEEKAESSDNNFTERTEHPFASFSNLAPLTEPDVVLAKVGEETINGKGAIGIRATSPNLGEVTFYFAQDTGLLLKSKKLLSGTNPSRKSLPGADLKKPSTMESFLENYQDVQGIRVPMRIVGNQEGKVIMDITLIEAKFQQQIDESAFVKP